jgi:ketosteroid isomerase-like protein
VPNLTPEDVRAEVVRFWNIFTAKAPELLEEFYAPDATVFASTGSRTEPGRLAVARRRREYFDRQTSVRVQVGNIEVQTIDNVAAVASYTFRFDAIRVSGSGGKASDEHLENGRATQLFILDAEGKLRILHEHLSSPVNPAVASQN